MVRLIAISPLIVVLLAQVTPVQAAPFAKGRARVVEKAHTLKRSFVARRDHALQVAVGMGHSTVERIAMNTLSGASFAMSVVVAAVAAKTGDGSLLAASSLFAASGVAGATPHFARQGWTSSGQQISGPAAASVRRDAKVGAGVIAGMVGTVDLVAHGLAKTRDAGKSTLRKIFSY